ncbi:MULTISPECIES: M15 family metallopeptidase [unclassified Enterococcus]|uniref:M15 family metallopeptidase n=1 Tax=unclassified Enterococcus TaxID=2608891 RepID=UPI0013EBDA2A|nr:MULTISPECIES: M15 family metallopeptidase [unclassified Enterococcus]
MNKFLGFGSVIIMIAAMGYVVVSEHAMRSEVQANVQKTEQTATSSKNATKKETKKETKTDHSSEKKRTDLPDASSSDWELILVGPDHKLEKEIDESTQLAALSNGYLVDKRIAPDYEEFAKAAETAGFPLVMVSAYRSVASQQEVFAQNVQEVMSRQGVSEEEATKITKETITEPDYSEHHTGLAVDVVDQNWYQNYPKTVLDADYGEQPGAKWIAENAAKYGFIVRYPKGREDITKITYEPWHLRYVGKENAEYITNKQLTLEEYLDELNEK